MRVYLILKAFLLLSLSVLLSVCMMKSTSFEAPENCAAPVFPGAQGFGTQTPAGRGGEVMRVTNLNDSGPGSLRAALEAPVPRIVVFEVGGALRLSTDLEIREPFVTVAGQTAPSPGVTIIGAGIVIHSHDVLIQHLRVRVGGEAEGPSPANRDAIQIIGPETYNVVIDHVSASWAVDENVSTWYEVHDVTISHSIISEALHSSIHPDGPHSMGLLIGDHSKNISLIGNLLAHNDQRNPRIKGDTSVIVLNNLFYNPRSIEFLSMGGKTGPSLVSAAGNLFIDGPDSNPASFPVYVTEFAAAETRVYLSENVSARKRVKIDSPYNPMVSTPPVWAGQLKVRNVQLVEEWVLSNAGARPTDRDAVDLRIVKDVRNRSGHIINDIEEVGGWPLMESTTRPLDLPDSGSVHTNKSCYTSIEEYLHQMAAMIEQQ